MFYYLVLKLPMNNVHQADRFERRSFSKVKLTFFGTLDENVLPD
jgi:hypothetical protein